MDKISTTFEKTEIKDVTYFTQTQISDSGVITIIHTPTEVIDKEYESKVNGIEGELISIQKQIDSLTEDKEELEKQLLELQGLRNQSLKNGK